MKKGIFTLRVVHMSPCWKLNQSVQEIGVFRENVLKFCFGSNYSLCAASKKLLLVFAS